MEERTYHVFAQQGKSFSLGMNSSFALDCLSSLTIKEFIYLGNHQEIFDHLYLPLFRILVTKIH